MKYNCNYCNELTEKGDDHTCPQCHIYEGNNFKNYEQIINGTFYCVQFRYAKFDQHRTVFRVGLSPLINFPFILDIDPNKFKEWCLSDKIRTYILFS